MAAASSKWRKSGIQRNRISSAKRSNEAWCICFDSTLANNLLRLVLPRWHSQSPSWSKITLILDHSEGGRSKQGWETGETSFGFIPNSASCRVRFRFAAGESKADGESVVHTPMMAALATNVVFLWSRNEAPTVARMARSPLGYCFINLTTLSIHVEGSVNWEIDGACLIRHHYASSEI